MSTPGGCKWDREAEHYVNQAGDPCKRDDNGDPTRHCTNRRSCGQHLYAPGEITCPRCIGRTRTAIKRIVDLATLMPVEALAKGVDSEAAMLAGPAADPEAWSWRRIAAAQQAGHTITIGDGEDETHPLLVLGTWERMIREDYNEPAVDPITVASAANYLTSRLNRIAQDPAQDFPLFDREMRDCRNRLEGVIRNSARAERGAPCPECTGEETGVGPRLARDYAHWCEDEDCTQRFHFMTDEADVWRCPRQPKHHWWTQQGYADLLSERQDTRKRGA